MDLIKTIHETDDVPDYSDKSDEDEDFQPSKPKNKKNKEFEENFEFVSTTEEYNKDTWNDITKYIKRNVRSKVDEKIVKVRKTLKKDATDGDADDGSVSGNDNCEEISLSEDDLRKDEIKVKEKKLTKKKKKIKKIGLISSFDSNDEDDEQKKKEFFEDAPPYDENVSFYEMNLSRPLMKAIGSMGFVHPTPIQAATITVALQGRDVCGCAATGTGKTAAYMLPTLERLIYKPLTGLPVTRVIVLVPTRELGVQVYSVTRQLAQFTNVEIALAVGGLDVKVQEAALRKAPDIVIATPGRLIDHLKNTPSFSLNTVEVLILDEADRMLDEYFQEQMTEIIKQCSRTRQTLLFSATMTDAVTDLAAVSLDRPVRIFVDNNRDVAFNLRQEFVKIRKQHEADREGILAALVCRTFHDHAMVFVQTKKEAHRIHILLGLLGVKVGELHGNMTQPQRLEALRKFRDEELDILVATDVAARGLDIRGVKTVINFILPPTLEHYIHRVGRTARAGHAGVSVSLCGDTNTERKIVKEIIKRAHNPVKSRIIPTDILIKYRKKVEQLEEQIKSILQEEWEERALQRAENQMNKMKNIIESKGDVERPRTWFQSQKERQAEKERLKLEPKEEENKKIKKRYDKVEENNVQSSRAKFKQKNKKVVPIDSAEDRVQREMSKVAALQARIAKRKRQHKKMKTVIDYKDNLNAKGGQKRKSSFARDLTDVSKSGVKRLRYSANKQMRQEKKTSKGSFPRGKLKKT
ncbi:dead-box helicase Rs1 [Lycorma delicatula]|uniref:dead-box helicase Rs1 n=1 Tax=Lycorma delicatula TaxID=130591 RepID=UPI003F50D53D